MPQAKHRCSYSMMSSANSIMTALKQCWSLLRLGNLGRPSSPQRNASDLKRCSENIPATIGCFRLNGARFINVCRIHIMPQPVSLQNVISQVLKEFGLEKKARDYSVLMDWPRIVGEKIASATAAEKL